MSVHGRRWCGSCWHLPVHQRIGAAGLISSDLDDHPLPAKGEGPANAGPPYELL